MRKLNEKYYLLDCKATLGKLENARQTDCCFGDNETNKWTEKAPAMIIILPPWKSVSKLPRMGAKWRRVWASVSFSWQNVHSAIYSTEQHRKQRYRTTPLAYLKLNKMRTRNKSFFPPFGLKLSLLHSVSFDAFNTASKLLQTHSSPPHSRTLTSTFAFR